MLRSLDRTPTVPTSPPSESAPSVESETLEPDGCDAIHATTLSSLPSESGALESERRWLVEQDERRRIAAQYGRLIRPGEDVCWTYCWDMARCGCPSTNRSCGVPVLPVARRADRDRCLQCGKSWRPPGVGERITSRIPKRKRAA